MVPTGTSLRKATEFSPGQDRADPGRRCPESPHPCQRPCLKMQVLLLLRVAKTDRQGDNGPRKRSLLSSQIPQGDTPRGVTRQPRPVGQRERYGIVGKNLCCGFPFNFGGGGSPSGDGTQAGAGRALEPGPYSTREPPLWWFLGGGRVSRFRVGWFESFRWALSLIVWCRPWGDWGRGWD